MLDQVMLDYVKLVASGIVQCIRLGKVSLGQVRLGQVRLGQVRLGQVRLGQIRLDQVRLGLVRLGQLLKVQYPVKNRGSVFSRLRKILAVHSEVTSQNHGSLLAKLTAFIVVQNYQTLPSISRDTLPKTALSYDNLLYGCSNLLRNCHELL